MVTFWCSLSVQNDREHNSCKFLMSLSNRTTNFFVYHVSLQTKSVFPKVVMFLPFVRESLNWLQNDFKVCVYYLHRRLLRTNFSLSYLMWLLTVALSFCLTKYSITVQLQSHLCQLLFFQDSVSLFKESTAEIESLLFSARLFFFFCRISRLLWLTTPNYTKCCFIIVSGAEMKHSLGEFIPLLHVH